MNLTIPKWILPFALSVQIILVLLTTLAEGALKIFLFMRAAPLMLYWAVKGDSWRANDADGLGRAYSEEPEEKTAENELR